MFGNTVVQVWPGCLFTILADGKRVAAAPQDNDAYRATARRLGYGPDTARMSRDHEILHTLLCHLLGLPESPTLRRVADGLGDSPLTDLEEDMVCATQAFLNRAGIDLLDVLAR